MLLMNVCLCNLGQVVILKCNNSANSFLESFMMLLKQVHSIVYAERFKRLLCDLRDSQNSL